MPGKRYAAWADQYNHGEVVEELSGPTTRSCGCSP
jgi:hypothetical protein